MSKDKHPKPPEQPFKPLSDEQERSVAEIKRHHPMATTEGILKHLKEWGWSRNQPRSPRSQR